LKKKISLYKLLNLFLRAAGMGAKFVLILLLSKYYTDTDYRDLTLIMTFVTLSIYVIGVDFYNYSIRDILMGNEQDGLQKVVNSFFLYGIIYIIFGILYYLFFDSLDFINQYALAVFVIALTEHLSQEIYRLLIAFGKVLLANFILFFRLFGWVSYVIYYIQFKGSISLHHLLTIWYIFNLISIITVALYFGIKNIKQILTVKIKKKWIINGLKISSVFFAGTILLKIIEYANRFVVDYFLDDIYVGIYGFYTTIALIVTIYINTIVISFELPSLIKNTPKDPGLSNFAYFRRSIIKQLIIIIFILSLFIYPLLQWQGKSVYSKHISVFFIVLGGVFFMNLSLVEHFMLYVKHQDKRILYIMVISGIFSLFSAIILTYVAGIYGTAISFFITGVLMYYLRKYEVRKMKLPFN